MQNLTLVIPAKFESTTLPDVLKEIDNLKLNCKKIVVVPEYDRETIDSIKQFDCKIYQKGDERSKQRNFGIQQSNSNIILFLDCDMIIGPELLSKYAKFFISLKSKVLT